MNGVIIVAVLSCMNSGIYVCSRVLVALAEKGEAPAFLATHDRRGVPTRAILIGSLSGSMAVMASVLSAERLFAMLVNATGMVMLIVYLLLVRSEEGRVGKECGRTWRSRWAPDH